MLDCRNQEWAHGKDSNLSRDSIKGRRMSSCALKNEWVALPERSSVEDVRLNATLAGIHRLTTKTDENTNPTADISTCTRVTQ